MITDKGEWEKTILGRQMDKEKIKKKITDNIDIKLIAIILSFFLWLYLKLTK